MGCPPIGLRVKGMASKNGRGWEPTHDATVTMSSFWNCPLYFIFSPRPNVHNQWVTCSDPAPLCCASDVICGGDHPPNVCHGDGCMQIWRRRRPFPFKPSAPHFGGGGGAGRLPLERGMRLAFWGGGVISAAHRLCRPGRPSKWTHQELPSKRFSNRR